MLLQMVSRALGFALSIMVLLHMCFGVGAMNESCRNSVLKTGGFKL